jgi:hypothetical protein
MRAWGLENDAMLWNAVKYIGRAGKKDDALEDLRKARWYLNNRIESLENENENHQTVRKVNRATVRGLESRFRVIHKRNGRSSASAR